MSEACEDRDGRAPAGGATMLQPVMLRLTLCLELPRWRESGVKSESNIQVPRLIKRCRLWTFWTLEGESSRHPSVPTGSHISKNRVGQGWASPVRV